MPKCAQHVPAVAGPPQRADAISKSTPHRKTPAAADTAPGMAEPNKEIRRCLEYAHNPRRQARPPDLADTLSPQQVASRTNEADVKPASTRQQVHRITVVGSKQIHAMSGLLKSTKVTRLSLRSLVLLGVRGQG